MPRILYIGDEPQAARSAYDRFNMGKKPEEQWEVRNVSLSIEETLQSLLRGDLLRYLLSEEVKKSTPQSSCDGIVVEEVYRDIVPAIKRAYQNAPTIMLSKSKHEEVDGIDYLLNFCDIPQLPEKMLELIAAKTA